MYHVAPPCIDAKSSQETLALVVDVVARERSYFTLRRALASIDA